MNPAKTTLRIAVPLLAGIVLLSCARGRMPFPSFSGPPSSGPASSSGPAPAAPASRAVPGAFAVAKGPRIDHAKHLDKGLECADCHMKDREDGQPFEPRPITYEGACADCHDDEDGEKPEAERVRHVFFTAAGAPRWERAISAYGGDVRFSHAKHATDSASCFPCHGEMKGAERFVGLRFTMAACMSCHEQKGADNGCATCHTTIRADVAPASHLVAWRETHGKLAGTPHDRAANQCDLCHQDQAWCSDCHQKTPPASHAHLWKERHGALARNDRDRLAGRCDLCHDDQAYCDRCHREEPPRSHDTLWRHKSHGVMAALDRASCEVCHTTDYCVRCHEETAPRSHRGRWTARPSLHCGECHFPIAREASCRVCHQEEPQHETATDQPAWHVPGMNCRACHLPAGPGPGGAPPVPHLDNGSECQHCHR